MTPRVLCVGDAVALRPAVRVAACAGADVEVKSDPSTLEARALDPHVIVYDLGDGPLEPITRLVAACPEAKVVILASPSPPAITQALLEAPWFAHLLGRDAPWFMDELTATLARLFGRNPFGLESFLPWGSRIQHVQITGSADKARVFDRIEAFMATLGLRGRLVHRLMDIADEMLMNAIYDAPVDRGTGASLYAAQRRDDQVHLEARDQPTFSFGSDGQRLVFGISDPFGGLEPETLKRYVAKGLRRGADQIDEKEGGAGLGLFLMFKGAGSLCLNLDPGRCTQVVTMVNIRGSMRDALATPKSFNIFVRRRG